MCSLFTQRVAVAKLAKPPSRWRTSVIQDGAEFCIWWILVDSTLLMLVQNGRKSSTSPHRGVKLLLMQRRELSAGCDRAPTSWLPELGGPGFDLFQAPVSWLALALSK